MLPEDQKPWNPLSVADVARLFDDAPFLWWIAGGWAIEYYIGRNFRTHDDIDVLVLQRDAKAARDILADWDVWASDPPGHLRPWPRDEILPVRVSDAWCRTDAEDAWRLQLMLDGAEGDAWVSRRAAAVTLPITALTRRDAHGVPFLVPEVQLFYKARAPRPKDTQDFEMCLPLLSVAQRKWLREAIATAYGDHALWLGALP